MTYLNHSGGCLGADMTWETECLRYGIDTIAYSFHNHVQYGANPYIMTSDELDEGWEHVQIAERTLRRNLKKNLPPYIKHLLCRNWFQVKYSDAIFAVGMLQPNQRFVDGGTGWACQMAIDNNKPVYLIHNDKTSYGNLPTYSIYNDIERKFIGYHGGVAPRLTKNFAGIGTRKISAIGIDAIYKILATSCSITL